MTVGTEPIARYIKTVNHGITGFRLNPDDEWRKVEFSLVTEGPNAPYEDTVLELYTEKEHAFFRQANRYLFQAGLIQPYQGEATKVDTTNVLTSDEIYELASTRNIQQLSKRLADITSKVTMTRILEVAQEIGRPAKTLEFMKERLSQL